MGSGKVLQRWYQRSRVAQATLLVVVMIATTMVIGDGVLTPSISGGWASRESGARAGQGQGGCEGGRRDKPRCCCDTAQYSSVCMMHTDTSPDTQF